MQGIGRKRAVIHLLVAQDEQQTSQDIGESKAESKEVWTQVERHERQEKEERKDVDYPIDSM